jgi:hypothetical protein
VLINGCLPVRSIHPFYTQDNIAFTQDLVGRWGDPKDDGTWMFVSDDKKTYSLYIEEDNEVASFKATLFLVDDTFMLDVVPNSLFEECGKDNIEVTHVLPLHGLLKMEIQDNRLYIQISNEDTWKSLLTSAPNVIGYTLVDNETILTDKSEIIYSYLWSIQDMNDLWEEPDVLEKLE